MGKIVKSKEDRAVKITIDDTACAEYGKAIGYEMEALGKVKLEQKAANEEYKERAKVHEGKIALLVTVINDGEEEKVVPCDVERDFGTDTVRYFHKKKLVEERPMTDEDRQSKLFDKDEVEIAKASKPKLVERDDVKSVIHEETNRKTKRDASTAVQ